MSTHFTPFVVLFLERSGSTYLVEGLASHPEVVAWPEYFAALREKGKGAGDQLDWLRGFLSPSSHPDHRAAGFKTKPYDVLDPAGFIDVLNEAGARLIVLQRRNVVKQAVSRCNAVRLERATGDWNLYSEEERLRSTRIELDEFERGLSTIEKRRRQLARFLEKLDLPRLDLFYEDILADHDAAFASCFAHLGVEPRPVRGRASKNTADDLRRAVDNVDELRRAYAGTAYEAMFDEVLVDPPGERDRSRPDQDRPERDEARS